MVNDAAANDAYKAAWNQFLLEFKGWSADLERWLGTLTTSEKVLGLCFIALAVLIMIIMQSKEKSDPGSGSRKFTVALTLVMALAFGAGLILDGGAGSLSYIAGR